MMWGYLGGPWGWAGPVMMLVFWVLVIGGVAVVLRSWWASPRAHDGADALSVLRRRYAAGELTREEYLRMRDDLGSGGG